MTPAVQRERRHDGLNGSVLPLIPCAAGPIRGDQVACRPHAAMAAILLHCRKPPVRRAADSRATAKQRAYSIIPSANARDAAWISRRRPSLRGMEKTPSVT